MDFRAHDTEQHVCEGTVEQVQIQQQYDNRAQKLWNPVSIPLWKRPTQSEECSGLRLISLTVYPDKSYHLIHIIFKRIQRFAQCFNRRQENSPEVHLSISRIKSRTRDDQYMAVVQDI